MEHSLRIGLFQPGMSHQHRLGLAGLYMTLKHFTDQGIAYPKAEWELSKDAVTINWDGSAGDFFKWLIENSFGFDRDGLVDFAAHRAHPMGDVNKIHLSQSLLGSYLQHPRHNKIPKKTHNCVKAIEFGIESAVITYRPFVKPYAHSTAYAQLSDVKGKLKGKLEVKGWLFPGAAERHSGLSGITTIHEPPEKFLCLLYSPVASLFFRLSHRSPDGKYDERRGVAIVIPHVDDLSQYSHNFNRYLLSPVEHLSADSVGDAGLLSLVLLKAEQKLKDLGISGCSVITLGTVGWAKQQKTRTQLLTLDDINIIVLDQFDLALHCLPNRILFTSTKTNDDSPDIQKRLFVSTSYVRGFIAGNIAEGIEWFRGFSGLMASKKQAQMVFFEKGGLQTMVEEIRWDNEADKTFIDAVHAAIRNRYGALAAQASKRGEKIPFDREFTRMRTGLMRAKNAQTLRAELADLFARGGVNKVLQEKWQDILPIFSSHDWQRSRDLALLALASYAGKGAEHIEATSGEENVPEE